MGLPEPTEAQELELPGDHQRSFLSGGRCQLHGPPHGAHAQRASARYEYLEVCRALLMPGAVVLAGWPAFPWGAARPWSRARIVQGAGRDRALRHLPLSP